VRKDTVSSNQPELNSDCEPLWVTYNLKTTNILVGSFYFDTDATKPYNNLLNS